MDYFAAVDIFLAVLFTAGIVIGTRMLKRGGGKAARLILIGCCLLLVQSLIYPFSSILTPDMPWLAVTRISLVIISLTGTGCLVYALWIKWSSTFSVDNWREWLKRKED